MYLLNQKLATFNGPPKIRLELVLSPELVAEYGHLELLKGSHLCEVFLKPVDTLLNGLVHSLLVFVT